MIELSLLDHPGTAEDTVERFQVIGRRFGFYGVIGRFRGRRGERFDEWMHDRLDILEEKGRVARLGERYALTTEGRIEAERLHEDLTRTGRMISKALAPETASLVTMMVHFVLAAVKLPAALISGSVGLLNDAADTLMDGLSSLLVFFGIRKGFERIANIVLVSLMTLTAVYALWEAVRRVFVPVSSDVDLFAFVAVAASSVICLILFLYQRLAGLRSGCGALITQSVDSRNHIIASLSTGAGLAALTLDFAWLDIGVGLVVAVIIGKSALELIVELLRNPAGEDGGPDPERYGLFLGLQDRQAVLRMIFMAWETRYRSADELQEGFLSLLNTESSKALQALGLQEMKGRDAMVRRCLEKAFGGDLSATPEGVVVTEEGLKKLRSAGLLPGPPGTTDVHRQGWFHSTASLLSGAAVFSILFFLGHWAQNRWDLRRIWADPPNLAAGVSQEIVRWAGIILAGLFFSLVNINYRHAVRHIRHVRKGDEAPVRLEDSGPYARTRHPMYAGWILKTAVLTTALGSFPALAAGVGLSALHAVNAAVEDRRMERIVLPESYPGYKARVKGLLFTPVQLLLLILLGIWTVSGLFFLG